MKYYLQQKFQKNFPCLILSKKLLNYRAGIITYYHSPLQPISFNRIYCLISICCFVSNLLFNRFTLIDVSFSGKVQRYDSLIMSEIHLKPPSKRNVNSSFVIILKPFF